MNHQNEPEGCEGCAKIGRWQAEARAAALDLERLLDMATDDDVLYDHPVAQSGEPMDPVLFVRWDFIRAALADRDAT